MILFYDDWAAFPSAKVHLSTKNESFLRLAQLYKTMGIRNHAFHLALINPELEHIDPHADNLTVDQMMAIGMECRWNPWYFFREVARVPPQASQWPLPFRANRGNIAVYWLFFNHVDVGLVQPRQTGKSVSTDILMEFLIDIGATNTRINLLTKDEDLRKQNVERIKAIREYVPDYLKQLSKKDADNKEEITCVVKGNRYRTAVGQSNAIAANKVGRGLTSPIQHIDEGPFIPHINVAIPAMLAGGNAVRDEAETYGAPYGNIFTTTAGKKDDKSGKFMHDLFHDGMVWTEHLFDCANRDELLTTIQRGLRDKEGKIFVNCTFSHRQLGYTDEWLRKKIAETKANEDQANRDFFNIWTSGGVRAALSIELNELIRSSQKEPLYTEITKDRYIIRWYIEKDEIERRMGETKYVLGMDTSEAIGRDSITMVLMDVRDLSVVASANVNETNLIRFSNFINEFMAKYDNVILIPERKSTGSTFVDSLLIRLPMVKQDPFKRIYNLIVDESAERQDDYRMASMELTRRPPQFTESMRKYFGFVTAGSGRHSRDALYSDTLHLAAKMGGSKVNDKPLIDEILGLEVKNGRIDHAADGHDDMVVAWMLCVWFLMHSKNLKHYGITDALSMVREFKGRHFKEPDAFDLYEEEEQKKIRAEIEEYFEQYRKTNDDVVAMKIENRIKTLNARLKDEYVESVSIDMLLKDAQTHRAKYVREAHYQQRRNPVSTARNISNWF